MNRTMGIIVGVVLIGCSLITAYVNGDTPNKPEIYLWLLRIVISIEAMISGYLLVYNLLSKKG